MAYKTYPQLNERVFWQTLPNGLTVAVVPRPGFTKKLAYFVTDFGAIHREFTVDGVPHTVHPGIAHFLEHKLFDMPGGRDVSAEFAAMGASPNAFTSYDMTAYYFSCTENFPQALELLLEFVSTPYFTAQTVAKEQGIIGQEIGMNRDNPDSRSFEQLVESMYQAHPVNTPILGTKESIAAITAEELHLCHRAFYRPDNMLLCVMGDVDPEEVVAIAKDRLGSAPRETVLARRQWEEPLTCKDADVSAQMEVAMPMFQLGFKCAPMERGEAAIRREIVGELAAEALFGESSALYTKLYNDGIIDASFGGGYETIEGMAMLTLSGDSDWPEQVRDAVLQEARRLTREGIGEKAFLRMKRSALGRRVKALDSFNSVLFRLCAYHFSGFDYFLFPKLYQSVTEQELLDFLGEAVQEDRMAMSIIYPKEAE